MENLSLPVSATHAPAPGFAQQFIQSIKAAIAERRALRREQAAAEALQHMEPQLLADFGLAKSGRALPMEQLANFTPAVVAAGMFSRSRSGR